jgi:hypothetical protein
MLKYFPVHGDTDWLDLTYSWCGPCHALSPILVKLTSDASLTNGKELDLMTVDTDREVELAQKYRVCLQRVIHPSKDADHLAISHRLLRCRQSLRSGTERLLDRLLERGRWSNCRNLYQPFRLRTLSNRGLGETSGYNDFVHAPVPYEGRGVQEARRRGRN